MIEIKSKDLLNKYERIRSKFESSLPNDTYLKTYGEILSFAQKLKFDQVNDLVILSHVVYAWMPTILTYKLSKKKDLLEFLKEAKDADKKYISNSDLYPNLALLKSTINNSIVGSSKLLHFINPDVFPIWDSRIAKEVAGIKQANNIKHFLNYLTATHEVLEENNSNFFKLYHHISNLLNKNFSYKISPIRTIELILYYNDKL